MVGISPAGDKLWLGATPGGGETLAGRSPRSGVDLDSVPIKTDPGFTDHGVPVCLSGGMPVIYDSVELGILLHYVFNIMPKVSPVVCQWILNCIGGLPMFSN